MIHSFSTHTTNKGLLNHQIEIWSL